MTSPIQFIDVSKKYRLGMTRVSLPELVSIWARSAFRGTSESANDSRDFWALREVSFSLQKGDSLALVGENGAGKTTILKLLANITKPTSGDIHVNGTLSALIELGAGFHPDLSGRENIFLNGTILGLKKEEIARKFDSIVDFAGLEKFIDTPVKRYSSGMAVRLGFAVAASIDPDVLLVDEVLAVGDAAFRLKCINRIQELINNGTTLVFVSHNTGLVKAVCQKALFIEKGQNIHFGSTHEVIETYKRALDKKRASKIVNNLENEETYSDIIRISHIEVTGQETNSDDIAPNSPVKISMYYQASKDFGEASAVFRIIRSDGTSCIVLYSNIDHVSIKIKKGSGLIAVMIDPIQLFPGIYQVRATLKNRMESVDYDMVSSDWFEINGQVQGYNDLDGVFEPKRVWL